MQRSLVVEVVKAVAAVKRKDDLYRNISFFGKYDFWRYIPVFDKKLCEECRAHWGTYYFKGNEIRATFPYLKIVDEDTIDVEVHPNCRCYLWRVILGPDYEKVYRTFYGD